MQHIARQLQGKVADLRWLELPGLPDKGDASDWLSQGHTAEAFTALAEQAPVASQQESDAPAEKAASRAREKFLINPSQSSPSSHSMT